MADGLYSTWGHNSNGQDITFSDESYHTPKHSPPTTPTRKNSPYSSPGSDTTNESAEMDTEAFDLDFLQKSYQNSISNVPSAPPGLGHGPKFESPFPAFPAFPTLNSQSNGLGYTQVFPNASCFDDFEQNKRIKIQNESILDLKNGEIINIVDIDKLIELKECNFSESNRQDINYFLNHTNQHINKGSEIIMKQFADFVIDNQGPVNLNNKLDLNKIIRHLDSETRHKFNNSGSLTFRVFRKIESHTCKCEKCISLIKQGKDSFSKNALELQKKISSPDTLMRKMQRLYDNIHYCPIKCRTVVVTIKNGITALELPRVLYEASFQKSIDPGNFICKMDKKQNHPLEFIVFNGEQSNQNSITSIRNISYAAC